MGEVASLAREAHHRNSRSSVLIFDDVTGEQVDLDLSEPGDAPEAEAATLPPAPARGPGRPKLGVVAREVTLLPRHWDWLNEQPGGASVALRKLVEEARKANAGKDQARRIREAAYRFMSSMGGNLPGFEDASRALFAGNRPALLDAIHGWPGDIRDHLDRMTRELS
jgi:hypothetical protein